MISKRKLNRIKQIVANLRFDSGLVGFAMNYARRLVFGLMPAKRPMPWPTTFALELTNRCNLHCTMCPREHAWGKTLKLGQMDTALAKRLLDQGLPYAKSIGLTGMGETFFASNLLEVARYAKERKPSVVVFVSTNANFPGFIDKAAPVLRYIDTLQVSIDGTGATYDGIRLGGRFDDLLRNLERLVPMARREGTDLMFNMVIHRGNYHSMADVVELASRLGVLYVNFNYINLVSMPDANSDEYDFFKTERFQSHLAEFRKECYKYPEVEVTGLDLPQRTGFGKCPLVTDHFQINADGEVPPCCAKPFAEVWSYGSVADGRSLIEVLNSERAKEFRAHLGAGTVPGFCRGCHFVEL